MKPLGIAVLLLCAATLVWLPPLPGLEEEIVLGGEGGWSRITRTDGVRIGHGKGDVRALMLEHAEYRPGDANTDLLLHFNETPIRDSRGRYRVRRGYDTRIASFARLGSGSGSFDEHDGGISLDPGESSLFSSAPWGDFSIEFWLYPARLEEGETILRWEGRRSREGSVVLQHLDCSVSGRKLLWNFDRFFLRPGGAPADLQIAGRSTLIPQQWHHHLLRFDARSGVMEYLVDGIPEAVRYVTNTGRENGSVLLPFPGQRGSAPLQIGPSFSGFIDELRISRSVISDPKLTRYPRRRGVAETEILDLRQAASTVQRISVEHSAPAESELYCFYRTADSYERFLSSPPEWIRFVPGARLSEGTEPLRARWIQLRFELFTDGRGERSPAVSRAVLHYEPNPPPGPPTHIEALPRDGSVVLRWSKVENPDHEGYLVYYGSASQQYRGSAAAQGQSPIDVGKQEELRLSGLQNGRLYYFAVASYDRAGAEHHGQLSQETHARPSRIYGAEE